MLEKVLLVGITLLVLVLAAQILKRTGGLSLLAWEALVFAVTFTPAACFMELINDESPLAVAKTDLLVVSRFVTSLILVNLIVFGYLLLLRRRVRRLSLPGVAADLRGDIPLVYWLGLFAVGIGLVAFVASKQVTLVLASGALGLGDYSTYYDIRYELSQISSTTLEQYLFVISLGTILPLLTLYSLYRYLSSRRSAWLIRWAGLSALWLGVSLLYYAKQPILVVILSNVVLLALTARSQKNGARRFSWKWLMVGGVGLLLALFLIYKVLGAADDFLASIQLLGERFIVIPALTAYNHLYVFPDLNPHTFYQGSTLLNLLLAGGQTSMGGALPAYYIASDILTGSAFNMNTGFVGAGWAAMGYVGVVQGAVLIFGAFALWDVFLLGRKQYGILTILVAFFIGRIDNIQNIDLMGMMIQGGLVLAPLFMLALMHHESLIDPQLPTAYSTGGVLDVQKDHA